MKTRFLILGLAALCLNTSPAMANLFSFTYDSLQTWYSTGANTFTADVVARVRPGSVTRIAGVPSTASFDTIWDAGANHFGLSMLISNVGVGGMAAGGSGLFTLRDVDNDTITGNLIGRWNLQGSTLRFNGDLSNVAYTPDTLGETVFNGDYGTSASMVFGGVPSPWAGPIVELAADEVRFDKSWGDSDGGVLGGGVTTTIEAVPVPADLEAVHAPVPAALLLGLLGLGAAGLKLRRYA